MWDHANVSRLNYFFGEQTRRALFDCRLHNESVATHNPYINMDHNKCRNKRKINANSYALYAPQIQNDEQCFSNNVDIAQNIMFLVNSQIVGVVKPWFMHLEYFSSNMSQYDSNSHRYNFIFYLFHLSTEMVLFFFCTIHIVSLSSFQFAPSSAFFFLFFFSRWRKTIFVFHRSAFIIWFFS